MLVTISQTVPDSIYAWVMKSTTKCGEVAFKIKTGSSPLKIEFENAYCTNFVRNIEGSSGMLATLLINPEEITLNGFSFDNHWIN